MYNRINGNKCHGEKRGRGLGRGSSVWVIRIEIGQKVSCWEGNTWAQLGELCMSWGRALPRQREQCMQRCWGRILPGELEKHGGGPCGWSRVSEGERGRSWGQVMQVLLVPLWVRSGCQGVSYFCCNCSFPKPTPSCDVWGWVKN